jgi:hypothetical protein
MTDQKHLKDLIYLTLPYLGKLNQENFEKINFIFIVNKNTIK